MKDILLSEYKRRIEKVKSEEELERLALDEIKELKKKVYLEYEGHRDLLEELKEKIHKEDKLLIELQEKEIKKYNYILKMADGSYAVASKEDVEIASVDDLSSCEECEF